MGYIANEKLTITKLPFGGLISEHLVPVFYNAVGLMSKKKNFTHQYFFVSIIALVLTTWLFGPEPSVTDSAFIVGSVEESHSGSDNFVSRLDDTVIPKGNTHYLDDTASLLDDNATIKPGFNVSFSEVENALMMAKLDNVGALILDEQALASLNLVVSRLPENLTPQDIQKLQDLIMKAQPGQAGEQVAEVLGNYYHLKQAEKAWLESGVSANSLQAAIDQLEKVTAMREDYLGQVVADKLFLRQQEKSRFYLQRMAIQQDRDLSAQQKESKIANLSLNDSSDDMSFNTVVNQDVHQLNDDIASMRLTGAAQSDIHAKRVEVLGEQAASQVQAMENHKKAWENRYQSYQQAKQPILDSAITSADKQQQIEALLAEHYSSDELAGARAYDVQQTH